VLDDVVMNEEDVCREKKTWRQRVEATEDAWREVFQTLLEEFCATQAFSSLPCKKCDFQLTTFAVRCNGCSMILCGKCDHKIHKSQPFHNRTLETSTSSTFLLARQFVDEKGDLFSIGLSVVFLFLAFFYEIFFFRYPSALLSSRKVQ
jgi:hypothetical protein